VELPQEAGSLCSFLFQMPEQAKADEIVNFTIENASNLKVWLSYIKPTRRPKEAIDFKVQMETFKSEDY